VLTARGGRVLLGHQVAGVITDGPQVVGVRCHSGEQLEEMRAKAVILADGGFQNNLDLGKRFIAPTPQGVVQRNAGASFGTALTLCEALGARLVHLDSFYGHLFSADALQDQNLMMELDDLAFAGVVVDREGMRFCDEGLGGTDTANKLARRSDPY